MALRGEFGWEVVGPLADIGWRLRKHFYTIKYKGRSKEELIGSWTDYGPDKYLDDKDMHSVFKSLHQIEVNSYLNKMKIVKYSNIIFVASLHCSCRLVLMHRCGGFGGERYE